MIPIGEEIATYVDVDQFVTGLSQDTCGFITVILNHYATERGKPYGASQETLQAMQKIWYTKFDGPDVTSNHNGMTDPKLYQLVVDLGNHYQNLYPNGGVPLDKLKQEIPYWISNGYPVIVAIAESSVHDMEINGSPYDWNTNGLSHIITITGITKDGNVLVRDTANVDRAGPREYDLAKLELYEATVFVPHWLHQPFDAYNVDTPTQHVPSVPPTPKETIHMISIQDTGGHFKEINAGQWQCVKNGFTIEGAVLSFYQTYGGNALCGLTYLGLPVSNILKTSHPDVTYQRFERGVVIVDPSHVNDNPPGSGSVYMAHLDSGLGQDPQVSVLTAMATQDKALIASLQAGQQQDTAHINDLMNQLSAAQSPNAGLQTQFNQLIQQYQALHSRYVGLLQGLQPYLNDLATLLPNQSTANASADTTTVATQTPS